VDFQQIDKFMIEYFLTVKTTDEKASIEKQHKKISEKYKDANIECSKK
jgi:hypothetical protein